MNRKHVFVLDSRGQKDRVKVFLDRQPETPVLKVTVEIYKPNRSLAQNNLMWLWLSEICQQYLLSHGRYFTSEAWKHDFQEAFLGYEQIETPRGNLTRVKGTSKLPVDEFSDFLNKIEAFVGSEYGIGLPHPDDLYNEAMGRKKSESTE